MKVWHEKLFILTIKLVSFCQFPIPVIVTHFVIEILQLKDPVAIQIHDVLVDSILVTITAFAMLDIMEMGYEVLEVVNYVQMALIGILGTPASTALTSTMKLELHLQ